MPKIDDVAQRAGVSVTTVSRVLNNRGYISQKTRDKVNQAMAELNYQPNEMARALFRRRSNMIGLIIPTVAHPFFGELAYHLEYYADQRGYKLLLCNSNRNLDKEMQYIEMLKKNQVDGIIMGSAALEVEHYLNLKLPIVSFERSVSEHIPRVTSDNHMGGRLAARHLRGQGCERLAYVCRGLDGPHHQALSAVGRGEGFREELALSGIEPLYMEMEAGADPYAGEAELAKLLQAHPEIDGIFASSDVIASEVIQACRKLGREVPQQLRVVGYDDSLVASLVSPRLTTIRQPVREMSERTIRLLLQQIEGEQVPMSNRFQVTLVVRDST